MPGEGTWVWREGVKEKARWRGRKSLRERKREGGREGGKEKARWRGRKSWREKKREKVGRNGGIDAKRGKDEEEGRRGTEGGREEVKKACLQ